MATTNPCFSCPGTVTTTNYPCVTGECICFCDIYISPKDAVSTTCNVEGTVNLNDYENDTSICGEATVKFNLMYYDTAFYSDVSLAEGGVLNWTPASNSPTKTGSIVFKILCGDLAKLVTVTIGRKSNCTGVICQSGEYCNDCSGECVPQTSTNFDLTVTVD